MSIDTQELRRRLEALDLSAGLTRDQLREQLPDLPSDIYIYLPSMKKFYSADDVLGQTGANALARAEGSFVDPDLDLPLEGAVDDGGPAAFGHSISPGGDTTIGEDDLPGPYNDLGGNSLETRAGRGIPDEG